ncbi:hypothetical protein VIBNISOn1_530008 [Vibrio nigripulchritudo SOn1]|uniref:Uncharacterized protein n=1 Tax=Vibrio nigripulchritudo SOn1 TaxID=1238450 RepID=A0AAV2VVM3_9VIBR|nr:hypothetical protein VIBNISOn1_530008 [Vibrio nigripulchritudo SOn1]
MFSTISDPATNISGLASAIAGIVEKLIAKEMSDTVRLITSRALSW